MFYSLNILARKDGKFSIVWLAATRANKLSKKQCQAVDLCYSCIELCKHIPSSNRVKGAERFSLYLCSQLMFGIVVIFGKKHEYLLRELECMIYEIRQKTLRCLQLPAMSSEADRRDQRNMLTDVREQLERSIETNLLSSEDTIEEFPYSTELTLSPDIFAPVQADYDAITMKEPTFPGMPNEFEDLIPDTFGEATALNFSLELPEEQQSMDIVDIFPLQVSLQSIESMNAVSTLPGDSLSRPQDVSATTACPPQRTAERPENSTPVHLGRLATLAKRRRHLVTHDQRTTLRSTIIRKQLNSYASTVLPLEKVFGKESNDDVSMGEMWARRPGMRTLSTRLQQRFVQALKVPNLMELYSGDFVLQKMMEGPTLTELLTDVVKSKTGSSLELQRGQTSGSTGILRNLGSSDEAIDSTQPLRILQQMESLGEYSEWQNIEAAEYVDQKAPLDSLGVTELVACDRAKETPLKKKHVMLADQSLNDHLLNVLYKKTRGKEYITFTNLCPRDKTTKRRAAVVFHSLLELHSKAKVSMVQGDYLNDIRISIT
uniref:Rad21_Rec8_N domain-containing protein n=1 Tax=Trichuris muris TaxID=70415 RepID=A0A5S6QIA0_TRIMR